MHRLFDSYLVGFHSYTLMLLLEMLKYDISDRKTVVAQDAL